MGIPSPGSIAAAVATVLALTSMAPQLCRLWRTHDSCGVAPSMATVGVVSELAWVHYTIGGELWSAVPESFLATLVNLLLTATVARAGVPLAKAVAAAAAWGGLLVAAAVLGGWPALGALLPLAYAVQLAPSVWSAYRTGAPTGVAAGTWVMIGVESALWTVYGVAERDAALAVLGAFGALAAGAILLRLGATREARRATVRPALLALA